MLMGPSTFISIRNTVKASMLAEQKPSLPKGVGLLSWTLRSTEEPPETRVPNLHREPCCQCMQRTEVSEITEELFNSETNLAALEALR